MRSGGFLLLLLLPGWLLGAPHLPNHIFSRDAGQGTAMLVDKSNRSAYLVNMEMDRPRLMRSFDDLLLGENSGDKLSEGDKRTPEGVYRITRFIPKSRLAPLYGSGAFPIDYPNPLDRLEGRNGSGIWLHGRDDRDPDKQVTRGCVAFNNHQIGELKGLLAMQTPVIITNQAEFVSPTQYQSERDALLGILDGFVGAWESGDIARLQEYIHPDFRSSGMDRGAWLARKQRLSRHDSSRRIETDNVYIYKEDGDQVVFQFTQLYCANKLLSRGEKRLFFKRDKGNLRLITESFNRLPASDLIDRRVEHFVQKWLESWRAGDLQQYLHYYDQGFRDSRGRSLAEWRDYKGELFSRRPEQRIEIGDLQVKQLAADRYRVSFRQQYRSGEYSDLGNKTLILEGCPGEFKIVAERWRKLL